MNYRSIKIFFTFILPLFFIFSCSENKAKLTIPEDELLKVFFDLYAADYVIGQAPKEIRDSLKEVYTKQIFQLHDLSRKEFEHNLAQLQNDPQRFKKFYDKLDKYGEEMSHIKKDDVIPEKQK